MTSTSRSSRWITLLSLASLLSADAALGLPDDAPPVPPAFPFDSETAGAYQQQCAAWADQPVELVDRLGQNFMLVPPGTFRMGSPTDEPGRKEDETAHDVTLTRPFYLGKTEVTVGQFRQFVEATSYVTDGERNGGGHAHDALAVWEHRPGTQWRKPGYAGPFELADEHPVVHVSHADALAYLDWLNAQHAAPLPGRQYALPTEAQWEWACRAGSTTRFWWGDEEDATGQVANVGDRNLKRTHPKWPRAIAPMDDGHPFPAPVGSYRANAFGLHDMLGNVWEFCATRYGPYAEGPAVDPQDLDPQRGFAVRGGGWSNTAEDVRCATRNADPPHFCYSNLGFRFALVDAPADGAAPPKDTDDDLPRGQARAVHEPPRQFPHRIWAACDFEGQTPDYAWFGPAQRDDIPDYPGNATALGVGERPYMNFSALMTGINPVPGPRMGKVNGLFLRYRLSGGTEATFQHFGLTSEDNQHVRVSGLREDEWSELTIDFTGRAARNDGSPQVFQEGERMDDFKVFVGRPDDGHEYDLSIDDVIFFANDPALELESEPFPRRVIFLAAFDTGEPEKYWPGAFELADRDLPEGTYWRAARAVPRRDEPSGRWIRLQIEPPRPVGERTKLRFRYHQTGVGRLTVQVFDATDQDNRHVHLADLAEGQWTTQYVDFTADGRRNDGSDTPFAAGHLVDDLFFFVEPAGPAEAQLLVDEVVLFDAAD
jgi:formylglycine-generating enzyme required for sulfatase activity